MGAFPKAGGWRLTGLLGSGGMATVYTALGSRGEPAAVKVLNTTFASDPKHVRRFFDEVLASSRIAHKGVVKIFETGFTDRGAPFLVMELLEGETLAERASRKGNQRLPAKEVLWAADRLLDILVAAHAKKIVHRDIKPDNVFITHERGVKLFDFGIAHLRDDGPESERTRIGTVMGTLGFMPPEQASGSWDRLSCVVDIWAVGATIFTLLTGRPVHDEKLPFDQLLAAATRAAPSIASLLPWLPSEIVDFIDLSLTFDPAKRWPSARSMQMALRLAYGRGLASFDLDRAGQKAEDDEISEPSLAFAEPSAPPMSVVYSPDRHGLK